MLFAWPLTTTTTRWLDSKRRFQGRENRVPTTSNDLSSSCSQFKLLQLGAKPIFKKTYKALLVESARGANQKIRKQRRLRSSGLSSQSHIRLRWAFSGTAASSDSCASYRDLASTTRCQTILAAEVEGVAQFCWCCAVCARWPSGDFRVPAAGRGQEYAGCSLLLFGMPSC